MKNPCSHHEFIGIPGRMYEPCRSEGERYAGGRWYCVEHFEFVEEAREKAQDNPSTRFLRAEVKKLREENRIFRRCLKSIAGSEGPEADYAREVLRG